MAETGAVYPELTSRAVSTHKLAKMNNAELGRVGNGTSPIRLRIVAKKAVEREEGAGRNQERYRPRD